MAKCVCSGFFFNFSTSNFRLSFLNPPKGVIAWAFKKIFHLWLIVLKLWELKELNLKTKLANLRQFTRDVFGAIHEWALI